MEIRVARRSGLTPLKMVHQTFQGGTDVKSAEPGPMESPRFKRVAQGRPVTTRPWMDIIR